MIETIVRGHIAQIHDLIEAAVEEMLVTPGPFGVRVDYWPDLRVTVQLSLDVEPMCVSEYRR